MSQNQKITVYGHPTCPMVPPVLGMLKQAQAQYDYINIHADETGAERVRQINNGNESVPTLVFPDGSTLTEPSVKALRQKLEAMGYKVPLLGLLMGYMWVLIPIAVFIMLVIIGNLT